MRVLLDMQCSGCGWPATDPRGRCENCSHANWEHTHDDEEDQ